MAGIGHGQLYGYRVHGPWAPHDGLRFDATKVLLDPYGRAVATPAGYRRVEAGDPTDGAIPMKSVVVDGSGYDWEGDQRIERPFRQTVIYEAHVAGFTADPSSGVAPGRRGTYAGFIDKIPYLVDLGITAVELLPVFAFDRLAAPTGLVNYWGYQPVAFFAPHAAYASGAGPTAAVDEFRDLVKALHRAGIEVILDVVYNHTAEVGADGPTFGFRGFANDTYYLLDGDGGYLDYSGTGNTFNTNNPIVRRLIVDSLRYWVKEMHVDGFRFDLAAVLSRDEAGEPMQNPPALWDIETDPALAGTKLIAEAWDAGGLYEVGSFVGDRWSEWNGRFRDDVRAFVKGDRGMVRRGRPALPRQPGHLRPQAPRARGQHQLRHLPRRLHAQRPRLVRREAQRVERRGQPRRQRREPELELRGGGSDRRPRHRAAARAAGQEPPRLRPPVARGADAAHGRRGPPDAGRQQQRLRPRRPDELVRLDGRRAARRHPPLHPGPHPDPPAGLDRARHARRRRAPGHARATPRSSGAGWRSASPTWATTRTASR